MEQVLHQFFGATPPSLMVFNEYVLVLFFLTFTTLKPTSLYRERCEGEVLASTPRVDSLWYTGAGVTPHALILV